MENKINMIAPYTIISQRQIGDFPRIDKSPLTATFPPLKSQ